MRKRYSAEQWRAWLLEFEESGQTVQKFCDSKGTTANTFYNWLRRLKTDCQSSPQSQVRSPFVSVMLPATQVEFEFPGRVIARVANERQSLRPLLETLRDLEVAR